MSKNRNEKRNLFKLLKVLLKVLPKLFKVLHNQNHKYTIEQLKQMVAKADSRHMRLRLNAVYLHRLGYTEVQRTLVYTKATSNPNKFCFGIWGSPQAWGATCVA